MFLFMRMLNLNLLVYHLVKWYMIIVIRFYFIGFIFMIGNRWFILTFIKLIVWFIIWILFVFIVVLFSFFIIFILLIFYTYVFDRLRLFKYPFFILSHGLDVILIDYLLLKINVLFHFLIRLFLMLRLIYTLYFMLI